MKYPDPEDKEALDNAIAKALSPIEQKVIALRFGLNEGIEHTEAQIACKVSLPIRNIRNAERSALTKLKNFLAA